MQCLGRVVEVSSRRAAMGSVVAKALFSSWGCPVTTMAQMIRYSLCAGHDAFGLPEPPKPCYSPAVKGSIAFSGANKRTQVKSLDAGSRQRLIQSRWSLAR